MRQTIMTTPDQDILLRKDVTVYFVFDFEASTVMIQSKPPETPDVPEVLSAHEVQVT